MTIQWATPRRACRTVLDQLFSCLTAWLAPILCYTAEEAWWARGTGPEESVHLRVFPDVPEAWRDDELAQKWGKLRDLRRVVTGALERAREAKTIGSSLQAAPVLHIEWEVGELLDQVDMAEVAITSDLRVEKGAGPDDAFRLDDVKGVSVEVRLAEGGECQRCWRILPEVGSDQDAPETCGRCADVVAKQREAAE